MFQTKFVKKIKTHVLCSVALFFFLVRKSCRLWDKVEKYCTAGQTTDDNIIGHTWFACWITKAIDTDSEYTIFIASSRQRWLSERASILLVYVYCNPLYSLQPGQCCLDNDWIKLWTWEESGLDSWLGWETFIFSSSVTNPASYWMNAGRFFSPEVKQLSAKISKFRIPMAKQQEYF
jgi:hypothetical protein